MFPGRKPRRYGISHIHLRAAGTSQKRRRTGVVARFRTPPAASGGVDSLQAEPAGAKVLRGGGPGAGDMPAGVPRYRQFYVSVARKLPALAFGHRRPRHHRPRAVPEPGAAGGRGSALPVGQQSAGGGARRQPDSQPVVRPAGGGGAPARAHGRPAGRLPAGADPGENRRALHGGDGRAAGQVAPGGSAIGVPRAKVFPRAVPGDSRLMDEAREQQLAEALAHLMDGEADGQARVDAATRSQFPELAGEVDALAENARPLQPGLALPERLSGHKILAEIGAGGMGQVLLAQDEALGRKVAIKRLAPRYAEDAVLRARFMDEARAMARLNHPGIVRIYRLGPAEEPPHFVMEIGR